MNREEFDEEKYIKDVLDNIEMLEWAEMPDIKEDIVRSVREMTKYPLSQKGKERLLAQGIGVGLKYAIKELIDFSVENVPEDVQWHVLAYNLACYSAMENDKPNMLKYSRRAIELGKSKEQFLNDMDFDSYLDDPEFLESIGEISKEEMQARLAGGTAEAVMSLDDILSELCTDESKIRNASAKLEAIYAADPDSINAVLSSDEACHRMLIAAWLGGRDPSKENIERVADEAAYMYAGYISNEEKVAPKLESLKYYTHIQGMDRFLSTLGSIEADTEANRKRKDRSYAIARKAAEGRHKRIYDDYDIVAKNSVALAGDKVRLLYRIYSNLYFDLYLESACHRRDELHPAFLCCRDVSPSLLKYKEAYPWVGREYDLIDYADDRDPEDFDPLLETCAELAADTVKELVALGDSVGDGDRRFFIAWRLWENGLHEELADIITPAIRKCIHHDLLSDADDEKSLRLMAWIFGEVDAPIEDVVTDNIQEYMYVADEVAYFAKLTKFPARFIQLGLYLNHSYILSFVTDVLSGEFVNKYLMENGVDKKALIEYHISSDTSFEDWDGVLEDTETVVSMYPDLDGSQRVMLVNTYYMGNEDATYDLMASAVLSENDEMVLYFILGDMKNAECTLTLLPTHPKAAEVKEKLLKLAEHRDPNISGMSRDILKAVYQTSAGDSFTASLKDGAPASYELTDILSTLVRSEVDVKGARKVFDKHYKGNKGYFLALLGHPRPGYRLLISAYLYGREEKEEYLDVAVKAAAEVYALSAAETYDDDIPAEERYESNKAAIGRFPEIPGASDLAEELEKYTVPERVVYSEDVLWRAVVLSDIKLRSIYRLACLSLKYAEGKLGHYGSSRAGKVIEAVAIIDKPLGTKTQEEAFKKQFPEVWAEYDLAVKAYSNNDANVKNQPLHKDIKSDSQTTLVLLKEWPKPGLTVEHYHFARQAWSAEIGKSEFDRYVKDHESVMRRCIRDNTPGAVGRFLDFIYGRNNVSIEDVGLARDGSFDEAVNMTDPFIGLADFPAALYRYILFSDGNYDSVNEYFGEDQEEEDILPYLKKNGMTDLELLRYKIKNTDTEKKGFKLVNENRELFRKVIGTLSEYFLQDVFAWYAEAKKPGELDVYFDEYLARQDTDKYELEWREKMEYYLRKMNGNTLKKILDAYPRKDEVIALASKKDGYNEYSEKFLKLAGILPSDKTKG